MVYVYGVSLIVTVTVSAALMVPPRQSSLPRKPTGWRVGDSGNGNSGEAGSEDQYAPVEWVADV